MRKLFIFLVSYCLLVIPIMLVADNSSPVEIPLVEIVLMEPISGDGPLDSSVQGDNTPTHPTQFRAFIAGNTLSVSNSTATLPTQLIVRDNLGSVVVNRQFTQYVAQQMPVGAFTLELHTTSFTLQGYFEVNQ